MPQKNNVRIPRYIQKILTTMGYRLPSQFNLPKIGIRFSHYAIIISFVLYAIVTIMDIWSMSVMGWRAYVLLGLSTLTIMMTQIYNIALGKDRIRCESKKRQAHKKNRKNIHKVSNNIYYTPLKCETILLIIIFIIYVIVLVQRCSGIMEDNFFTYLLQILMSVLAIVNCFIPCVENFAEYYNAKGF